MSDKRFTWMHSGQMGAPQMSGASGSNGQMLQVLDACLINGFNQQTATIVTKTETAVTLTFGVSHGYELLQIIAVSGATDAALNGQHRVIAKTANTVTIDAVGVAVTTGTIATKLAPLGWQSIFGSADPLKRAYRSQDTQSSQTVLYLDMTIPAGSGYDASNPAKRAMVSLCENMTTLGVQINSYTDEKNRYDINANGRLFWYQSRGQFKNVPVSETASQPWVVVGNGKIFYIFNEWGTTVPTPSPNRDFFAFGDADSLDGSISPNNCCWIGVVNTNDDTLIRYAHVGASIGGNPTTDATTKGFMIKNSVGAGLLAPTSLSVDGTNSAFISGAYGSFSNFPNPATQKLIGFPVHLLTELGLRATLPRINAISQNINGDYAALDIKASEGVLTIAVNSAASQQASLGFYAINMRD